VIMANPPATKIGHGLAKVLGIKLDYHQEITKEELTRGESAYSIDTADTFVEDEPTSVEWIRNVLPGPKFAWTYTKSLFPFTHWITRYNLQWLTGDLIAGKQDPTLSWLSAETDHR
jgi:sodium-independent sulfate anion transporter 11